MDRHGRLFRFRVLHVWDGLHYFAFAFAALARFGSALVDPCPLEFLRQANGTQKDTKPKKQPPGTRGTPRPDPGEGRGGRGKPLPKRGLENPNGLEAKPPKPRGLVGLISRLAYGFSRAIIAQKHASSV